jgi:hypothetical protein
MRPTKPGMISNTGGSASGSGWARFFGHLQSNQHTFTDITNEIHDYQLFTGKRSGLNSKTCFQAPSHLPYAIWRYANRHTPESVGALAYYAIWRYAN